MQFTGEQQEAIGRRSGSLFLHAGAGSGKTRVLVERFVRAVLDDGVAVDRVLAITFTEKAAAELKGRLRRRVLGLGGGGGGGGGGAGRGGAVPGVCPGGRRGDAP